MGIFASRPEEPFEWAGLPSEPARPEDEAERLAASPVDTAAFGAAVLERGAVESIVIPVPAPAESAQIPSGAAGDDEPRDG